MNSLGHEYKQIGGDYKVLHHTEYLETLVANKKLQPAPSEATITYHDPCYLGRHNDVYDAPRNLLHVLSNNTPELPRNRENSFCCGAGGAQFWKEEEPGDERISDNRFREAQQTLATAAGGEATEKVLAVGCPFCKSMLGSTPSKAAREDIAIKDVAELLLEGVRRAKGLTTPVSETKSVPAIEAIPTATASPTPITVAVESASSPIISSVDPTAPPPPTVERKKWQPKSPTTSAEKSSAPETSQSETIIPTDPTPERKKWQPKSATPTSPIADVTPAPETTPPSEVAAAPRKKWQPKKPD